MNFNFPSCRYLFCLPPPCGRFLAFVPRLSCGHCMTYVLYLSCGHGLACVPCLLCSHYLTCVFCLSYGRCLACVLCLLCGHCLPCVPYLLCGCCLPCLTRLPYSCYLPYLPHLFNTFVFLVSGISIELHEPNGWSVKKYLDFHDIFIDFSKYSVYFVISFFSKGYSSWYPTYRWVKCDIQLYKYNMGIRLSVYGLARNISIDHGNYQLSNLEGLRWWFSHITHKEP